MGELHAVRSGAPLELLGLMSTHKLKTWPKPFAAIIEGRKRYEIRVNDRDYQVGDALHLVEFIPANGNQSPGMYTGESITAEVTYMTKGGEWGLPDDLCVMSIEVGSWEHAPA